MSSRGLEFYLPLAGATLKVGVKSIESVVHAAVERGRAARGL
jgi:hypothetical protein